MGLFQDCVLLASGRPLYPPTSGLFIFSVTGWPTSAGAAGAVLPEDVYLFFHLTWAFRKHYFKDVFIGKEKKSNKNVFIGY